MPGTVITIKWGDHLYGPHYVNRLYAGVHRNLSSPFRFVCFTDNSQGIRPEVEVYPLPAINLQAAPHFVNGRKLGLFQMGIGDLEGPCLYFDLDVIIVRSIDCFFEYLPGEFCVCREWLPPYKRVIQKLFHHAVGVNTSVFRFEANSMQFVIDGMNEAPQILKNFKLEQRWVAHVVGERVNWWPAEWVSSFKHRRPVYPFSFVWPPILPSGTRVMIFNGPLKPSHAIKGNFELSPRRVCRSAPWAAQHWID